MSGYRFLMDNYREGDRICLLGFSRGAYTARCLAGMLHKVFHSQCVMNRPTETLTSYLHGQVGLIPKCNEAQIQYAWKHYKDVTVKGRAQAEAFKKTFSIIVTVEFIGVWYAPSDISLSIPNTPIGIRSLRLALSAATPASLPPTAVSKPSDMRWL